MPHVDTSSSSLYIMSHSLHTPGKGHHQFDACLLYRPGGLNMVAKRNLCPQQESNLGCQALLAKSPHGIHHRSLWLYTPAVVFTVTVPIFHSCQIYHFSRFHDRDCSRDSILVVNGVIPVCVGKQLYYSMIICKHCIRSTLICKIKKNATCFSLSVGHHQAYELQ